MIYWLTRLGIVLFGYCFGIIETGMIYAKVTGVDLKHKGSGNTGATNTLRVAGAKAGVIVLLGDIFKCVIPMLIIRFAFANNIDVKTLMFYAGMGCILGHNFPFYAHFKGGKGVASTGALVLVLDPLNALICICIFAAIVYLTGYVSLGSMIAETCVLIGFILHIVLFGWYKSMTIMGIVEFVVLGFIMVLLCVIQHRANIERLVNHTENKIYDRNKKKNAVIEEVKEQDNE